MTHESNTHLLSPSESLPKPLSRVASEMFAAASHKFPASVTAQGVFLAQRCREEGYTPLELKEALVTDRSQIISLMNTANAHHRKHGVDKGEVSIQNIEDIVNADFNTAHEAMLLTDEDCTHILTELYKRYLLESKRKEMEFRKKVSSLILLREAADKFESKEDNSYRSKAIGWVVNKWVESAMKR